MKLLEKMFVLRRGSHRFKHWKNTDFSSNDIVGGGMMLCSGGIDELFDVPEECEKIWVSIHDTPSENNRVKYLVKLENENLDEEYGDKYTYPLMKLVDEDIKPTTCLADVFTRDWFDTFLEKQMGKYLYVQVEYEE